MDKRQVNFEKAKAVVQELYNRDILAPDPFRTDMVVDPTNGNMLLYYEGWNNGKRTYGCYLHLRVAEDGKVWVQYDGTDTVVIDQLIGAGIMEKEIVVGWHPPSARKHTEFAEG
ncbi:MAG: element excision factor XisI family protein [Bacteroidota bacterium]